MSMSSLSHKCREDYIYRNMQYLESTTQIESKSEKTHDHLMKCRKGFEKIQHPLRIKGVENLGLQKTYRHKKPTVNNMLIEEKNGRISNKSVTKHGSPLSLLLVNIVLYILTRTKGQEIFIYVTIRKKSHRIFIFR